jgi:hypothetical protein
MHASPAIKPTPRAADNELFDQGCDLVAAASAIRLAASAPEAARAVPAVLGCIESALQELMWAAAALEQTSADLVEQNAREPSARITPIAQRMHRGFANLQQALSDGERASAAARSLAARALTASGATPPGRRRRRSTA